MSKCILCIMINRKMCQNNKFTSFLVGTWAMTFQAEFNQEGHRVCLAHKTPDTLALSPALLNPIPDLYRGSAQCQVRLQYRLSGVGVRSKWDNEKSEIHTRIPSIQRSKGANLSPLGVVMGVANYPITTGPNGG